MELSSSSCSIDSSVLSSLNEQSRDIIIMNSTSCYNNMAYERDTIRVSSENNTVDNRYGPREMPIDCPDNFIQEINEKSHLQPCPVNPNLRTSIYRRNKESETVKTDDEKCQDLHLTNEGKYLIRKAKQYGVDNLKLVNIEKYETPLGATIRNQDGSIIIGRIIMGGAAEQSGLLHEEDEILEINSIPVRGNTIHDVCDLLANLKGIVSFLIIPNMNYETSADISIEPSLNKPVKVAHLRALFNYNPQEDLYIPCKELGLGFGKADILHIISQDDDDWWQAYKDDDKYNSLAGLIPSQSFQEKRLTQMRSFIGDSFTCKKNRDKGFCMRGFTKNKRRAKFEGIYRAQEVLTYEEVTKYKPPINKKRPIVLVGPQNIGRHELRKRLMQSNPFLFEIAVPHTTRQARRDEIDGKDYHFIPRHIFEVDIKQGRFVEYGEYDKNLYGTSYEAIKKVIDRSKICILNLYPEALKALRTGEVMPYVIYIGPPNLSKLKELKNNQNESFRESDLLDIIDKGREIEELYGHYFDKIIRNVDMNKTYQILYETILRVQSEEHWVPTNWISV